MKLNRRGLARVVPIAAAIVGTVAGLGLVAVSSERRAPHNQTGRGVSGLLENLVAAAAVVYVAIALYLVVVARFRGQQRPERPATQPLTGLIVFVMAVLLVSFLVTKFHRFAFRGLPSFFNSVPRPDPTKRPPKIAIEKPITWGYPLGFGLVVLMVVAALTMTIRSRRSRSIPSVPNDRRALVAVSIDDLLSDLDNESDPRRAVLLADHGMEMALAEHGLPRAVTETAHEHMQRVATELSLSNTAAQTLTSLYGQAHFSTNEITDTNRESAIASLRSVRDELQAKPPINLEGR